MAVAVASAHHGGDHQEDGPHGHAAAAGLEGVARGSAGRDQPRCVVGRAVLVIGCLSHGSFRVLEAVRRTAGGTLVVVTPLLGLMAVGICDPVHGMRYLVRNLTNLSCHATGL